MSLALSITSLAVSLATCAGAAVFAVKARAMRIQAEKDAVRAPGSRPTHPDGTPYRYHEIVAEGWGHCDGCRQWGQWTAENPHECAEPLKAATTVTVHNWDDPAQVGAEIARSLRRQRRDGGI